MHRIIGLDLLRAIAITLVLLTHFVNKLDFLGLYGVELFFALSGFLIGGILYRSLAKERQWSFRQVKIFWVRRWWRTLPNYYLFFLVSIPYHYYLAGGLPDITRLLSYLFFSQNLFSVPNGFYGVSWSLCIEEWFYLLFPLLIYLLIKLGFSKRLAFICATLPFLIIPPCLREIAFLSIDPTLVRQTTLPRLDAMFYGVCMSFIMGKYGISMQYRRLLFVLSMIILFILLVIQFELNDENSVIFYRVALVLLPITFSIAMPLMSVIKQLPNSMTAVEQPIICLSLWSYSIYLSHIPIMFAVYAIFGTTRESAVVNILSKFAGLVLCLFISRVLFVKFESRLTNFRPSEN